MISSYNAAALHMEKARSKAKGRPMKSAGWRMFQDGDEYVVTVHGVQIGRFLPDNTFMFTTTGEKAYHVAQTLSSVMHLNIPFFWTRYANRAYRVDHTRNFNITHWWRHFRPGHTTAPAVYDGLKFDLTTGRRLNARPDPKPVVDPERRKEWLAAIRAWRYKVKVIARIGGLDAIIADEKRNPTPWDEKPRWGSDEFLDILYKAIKDGDCSTDLLRMFAASEVRTWSRTSGAGLAERIVQITKSQSVSLRRRFGVLKGGDT